MHPNELALTDYIDGTLGTDERAELERHLGSCATCRQIVEESRAIKSVAGSLELREPPVRSWARLERAIKLEERPRAPRRSANWWQPKQLGWLAAAAGLVLATAIGLKYMPARTQQPAPAQTTNEVRAA